jgi:hypothetical protein
MKNGSEPFLGSDNQTNFFQLDRNSLEKNKRDLSVS